MSASALPPTAPTTLVILLGASAWPNSPGFQASEAFVHAAQGFKNYLLDPHSFGLPEANLLNQFDEQTGASDQLEILGSFLDQRAQALSAANQVVRDVLVYFVGHGGFAGPSADFYLQLRRTDASRLRSSGMRIDALAERLLEHARQTRRYLFLDCCFAAAAFRFFQGGPDQTAIAKTQDAFHVQARSSGYPRKGTVLLCSSDQKSPSLLLPDESCTMFSSALLDVLRNGDPHRPSQLSLRDIKELAEDRLAALSEKNAPRPGLYSPDQSEGDVADVSFFPNPRIEEEWARTAGEERVHKAQEEERVRREYEKQIQRVTKQETKPPDAERHKATSTPSGPDMHQRSSSIPAPFIPGQIPNQFGSQVEAPHPAPFVHNTISHFEKYGDPFEDLYQRGTRLRGEDNLEGAIDCWLEILDAAPSYRDGRLASQMTELLKSLATKCRRDAQTARRSGDWDAEIRAWRRIALDESQADESQARLRRAEPYMDKTHFSTMIAKERLQHAKKHQGVEWMYKQSEQRIKDGYLEGARTTLKALWEQAPLYGDPKKLARKAGFLIPLPLNSVEKFGLIFFAAMCICLFIPGLVLLNGIMIFLGIILGLGPIGLVWAEHHYVFEL